MAEIPFIRGSGKEAQEWKGGNESRGPGADTRMIIPVTPALGRDEMPILKRGGDRKRQLDRKGRGVVRGGGRGDPEPVDESN